MSKLKKILLIISIILGLSTISLFSYFFINSTFYELECSRINDGEYEAYYFEYNILTKITKTTYKAVEKFSSQQKAKDYYNNEVDPKDNVELNGNDLIYYHDQKYHIGEKISVIKTLYTDLVYECKKVKK